MGAALVRAESIGKSYSRGKAGEVRAVRGIALEIVAGGVTFIVGPSGSGKSTLLHILGALDRPTSGRVFVEGSDLTALDDTALSLFRRRRVGFIFQQFNLIGTLSAFDNVLVPHIPGPGRIGEADRARARSLLEAVGLGARQTHRPNELSGGEQQRVAIARALISDPPLVLADEPTGELDTKTGAEIFALIRTASRDRGKTFVIVTHDTRFLETGDRVLKIEDGRLVGDTRVGGRETGTGAAARGDAREAGMPTSGTGAGTGAFTGAEAGPGSAAPGAATEPGTASASAALEAGHR